MPKMIILGASNAVPTIQSENTHLALVGEERVVLVDCVSTAIVRLEQAGIEFDRVTDIIITHFHPDHMAGVPLLLMDMWLLGRKKPLNIYGLHFTIDRMEQLMNLYGWDEWPGFFQVAFHRISSGEKMLVMDNEDFTIHASPVHHFIPNIGLRVQFNSTKKTMAYSCDTEPCEEVVKLSEGVDVLLHEAAGGSIGHSSAAQAGEVATKSEVGSLYLIHYPTGKFASGDLVAEAQTTFKGTVVLAKDFMEVDFSDNKKPS
jgi:ribonuclease Z